MAYKTNFLGNHELPSGYNKSSLSSPDNECLGILASFAASQVLLNTFKLQKHVMTNTLQERKIKVIDTKKIYTGIVSLRLDKLVLGDKIIKKEIVEHVPSVGLIPIIDNLDVLFVSQYRHAAGKTLLEIPAGKIEKGETPEKAALREMAEEIGYTGKLQSTAKNVFSTRLRY